MNEKYVLSELDRLKDKLTGEYSNSDINFDIYFQELKKVLLQEKIRCIFLHRDGKIECRHLHREEISEYYELFPTSIYNIVTMCSEDIRPVVQKTYQSTKRFRYKEIGKCVFYIEVNE